MAGEQEEVTSALDDVEASIGDTPRQQPTIYQPHNGVIVARKHKRALSKTVEPGQARPSLNCAQLIHVAETAWRSRRALAGMIIE